MLRRSEMDRTAKAVRIIEENLEELRTIPEIAREVGLNANKLQQCFREILGKTVNGFIMEKRLATARSLLSNTDYTLSTITSIIGYHSQSYFSKKFRETYGELPSEFRKNKGLKRFPKNNSDGTEKPR